MRRHLKHGTLMLYDVTSSYVEGRCNALADYGYNRDRKKGKMQLVYGLLCSAEGCPVAIEVFRGNTSDAATLAPQIATLKKRFDIEHIALAGDRGLINARIRSHLHDCGLDWISALKAPDIRKLCVHSQQFPFAAGVPVRLQLGGNSAQVASPTYFHPVCRTDADSE